VLFLDGGGIRGLIQLEILIEMECRLKRKITDLFDWIVGTSTGGIIALALTYTDMTLKDIQKLYLRMSPLVFGSFLKAVQNSANIESILKDTFKNIKMSQVSTPKIMIAAVNISKVPIQVEFFNNFNEDKIHLIDVPVWMVARATAAAPQVFTSFQGYVDGGVKANNPCEFAISEIREYYSKHHSPLPYFPIIVSIGTGVVPSQKLHNLNVSFKKNIKDILTPKHLFDLLIYAISDSEEVAKKFENQCRHMNSRFFRLNPPLCAEIKPTETNASVLINMIIKTKEYLLSGDALGKLFELVELFETHDELQNVL
jgi:calcium-independent phospholipase A2